VIALWLVRTKQRSRSCGVSCPVAVGRMLGIEGGGPAGSSGAETRLTRQPGCDSDQHSCSLALDRTQDWSTHAASDPRHRGPSEVSPTQLCLTTWERQQRLQSLLVHSGP